MRTECNRFFSILLTLAMVLGMIPAVSAPATATDEVTPIEVPNTTQLYQELYATGDAYIQLKPNDYPQYVWEKEMPSFVVRGNKILDLNGVTVEKRYTNDALAPEAVMFTIEQGASLTIIDSIGGGGLSHVSPNLLDTKSEFEEKPPVRDLFHVDGGTLIINDGTFIAGNSKDFWVTWGASVDEGGSYCGNIHYQTTGSVVTLKNGGTFIANGGHFEGRGLLDYDHWSVKRVRNSTIKADNSGNHVYINAGTFKGMGGADVFSLGANDHVDIRGGSFSLHHHKRLWGYDLTFAYFYSMEKGLIGLQNFWAADPTYLPYIMKAKWNNTVFSGLDTYQTQHGFMMSYAHDKGDVISYMPAPYTLPGGNLSLNGKASAEGYWNINQSAYVSCDVRTYYQQTDTIPEHRLTYTWTIKDGDGNAVSTSSTDTNQLNLSTMWANGRDELVISCQVEESGPSGTWGYFSKPITIHLSDLPLSEAKLPGGGIELDVEYGKTTKNGDYAIITVRPDQATVEDAFRFVDSVEYSLAYTDILGQSATAKINNGSYFIIETEAGDTEATLTMTLTDIYGKESLFTESVWLLRLPEITVTAETLRMSSDGSRYLITAGDASAKLACDATNLDSARFDGWFRTNEGKVSTDMTFTPTKSGNYTYRYYSKDGKLIISEPVTIDFTNYSSVTKKSEDAVYFYAPEDSGKPTDSVLTIELGDGFNQVSNPSVQWVLKSYPAGGKYAIKKETLDPNAITIQSGFPVNFCDFLDDSNGFVLPGDYVVQPVITFDTVDNPGLTAYGDVVTVTVHKYVDEIKPTANGKVIEDNSVITLPVGKSLDLSWMIGKYSEYDTANSAWYIDMGEYAEDTVVIEGETFGSTYQGNIKLTAKKPGQVKVSMSGSAAKDGLDDYMSGGVHNFTINVPVTEFEVTMGEAAIGVSGINFFQVAEDALYTPEVTWLNELQNADANKKFIKGTVAKASVKLVLDTGYVIPEELSDIKLNINGEAISLSDVETPSLVYDPISGLYAFCFTYNFGQMIPDDGTMLHDGSFEYIVPAVGDPIDGVPGSSMHVIDFVDQTSDLYSNFTGIMQVEAGADSDLDVSNDVDVDSDSTVFEEGKLYRLQINAYAGSSAVFAEDFTVTVNGETVYNNFRFGKDNFTIYCYFTPRALVDEILLELPAPAAMEQPTSLEMLNDGSNLVYPSSIQWFIDANANAQLDEGEGTAADFNADGSFKSNTAYSMMVIMNVYDRDYDGVGDDAAFADTITVKHDDESGAAASEIECTVTGVEDDATVIGICHTFAPTGTQDYALVANPNELTFTVVEGYTSVKPQAFTVESLGTETISAEQLTIFNETGCFEITRNGYTFTVQPLVDEMPTDPGNSDFSISIRYEDENGNEAFADVAIHFNVAEAYVDLAVEPESLDFYGVEGYESIDSKSFQIKNVGNYDGFYINPYTVTVRNESTEFEVKHEGDTVTVTPVQGLTEGTYEATLLVMANNYNIVVPVPITFYVDPQPEYGLEITPQTYPLEALIGYGEDTCAEFEIKSTGKKPLTKDDLTVEIRNGNNQGPAILDRYELTETEDGMSLKLYPVTGLQPQIYEDVNWPHFFGASVVAWKTVGEGEEATREQVYNVYAGVEFTVEYPSYSLSTRPASLEFSANKGYTDVSETILVFNTGTGEITAIRANVYEVTGGLSENFTATVDGMNVTVAPVAGLDAGTYTASVEIRDVENRASTTVQITFTVTDYQITVSPESFSFSGKEGDNFYFAADYTASATNGGDPVELTAELEGFEGKVWEGGFALGAPAGVNEIPAGTYTGYLVLSIPGTDYSKKVPITVTIEAVDYRLSVEPGTLEFKLLEGYQTADAKTVTVTSIGADAVSDITVALPTNTPVEPPVTISVADGANGSKIVTVTPKAGLDKDTYTTEICIGSESGLVDTITVPVTITVDGYTYGMKADVEELVFPTALEGYQTVESKTVIITSTGTGAITQLEEVYFKPESDLPDSQWFTVTTNGMTVTVTPAAGMARNIYSGWLMISAKGELISIPVTFEVACDHNWQVTVLMEPELGKHGMKHSVCTRCKQDAGIEEIPALEVCPHACMNCGGCRKTAPCSDTTHCECDKPGPAMNHTHVDAEILEDLDLDLVAEEFSNETVQGDELHPYEKYVADHVQGYMIETIYDISLRLNGAHYDLPDGESVTVRLDVGAEAAKKLDSGKLYLIHITSKGRVLYGTQEGQTPLTVEKDNGAYTGFISFETSEFSPFVLASVPEDPEIELTAEKTATGCTVTLESNVATTGHLYLAVYDTNGKMLSVDVISNFTFGLDSTRTFDMEYNGTAARVKGFLIQDYTFSPKHTALEYPF